jgi:DNA-binding NarL/FixJ family response regulator
MNYSVLIADQHKLFRECLAELFNISRPHLEILQAETGTEALFLLSQFQPKIMLINLGLSEVNGFQIMKKLNKSKSTTKVILMHNDGAKEVIQMSKKIGAAGFVSKEIGIQTLFSVFEQVETSNSFICHEWFDQQKLSNSISTTCLEDLVSAIEDLSNNERNVLRLFCQGFSTKEVAELLHVKTKSVDNYKNRIGRKINIDPDQYFLDWLRKNHEQLKLVV